ncbi:MULTISPECIES: hypothetical protein [Romboutsia]|uniref:hypothetical protein n=1 Tax=Romboutsia TaxID=1501226 RepID=UPI000B872B49|nr:MULTISPECIES: hypothetical protein [Romboutsia]MDB8804408.1 hypothetical protein [Romboutsia sp. 1001216sp1]MDB8806668.1 hypothetical protein [Romboutsia sp. 1001216sp1]MDB8810056.1 hypothetical protein [Romboutsia sp. 1001216sp1]MDB8815803.1 hypothetical protein [Romboutsia sp. 1001216sp1]MDB8818253.1 hypothetical protein [Romboutsia sp. 1001216sp1]
MKLTDKQQFIIFLLLAIGLSTFDAIFLPNTNFSSYNFLISVFVVIILIRVLYKFFKDFKSFTKIDILGYIVVFIIGLSLLFTVNT